MDTKMRYSGEGRMMTARFEGCRLKAYRDSVGVWTIGYGHTKGVTEDAECSQEQADKWLDEDISRVEAAINALKPLSMMLTQGQFDALVDFAFNLGIHALETSTLWGKLNMGDIEGASKEFPRWCRAGGKVLEGLLKRRMEEQRLFMGVNNETKMATTEHTINGL